MCEIFLEEKSSCLGNCEELENENKILSCLNCKGYENKSTLNFFKFCSGVNETHPEEPYTRRWYLIILFKKSFFGNNFKFTENLRESKALQEAFICPLLRPDIPLIRCSIRVLCMSPYRSKTCMPCPLFRNVDICIFWV